MLERQTQEDPCSFVGQAGETNRSQNHCGEQLRETPAVAVCAHMHWHTHVHASNEQLHTYTQNCYWNVFFICLDFTISTKFYVCSKAGASLEGVMFVGRSWCCKFEFQLVFPVCHSKGARCYPRPKSSCMKCWHVCSPEIRMEQPWMCKHTSPVKHRNTWWLPLKSNQF